MALWAGWCWQVGHPQEIAELCFMKGLLIASFFFSRTMPMRHDKKRLITMIAYQLALSIPVTRSLIENAIETDPAFFDKNLQVQLDMLVVKPLDRVYSATDKESTPSPYLILIDGLDECDGGKEQRYILKSLLAAATKCRFPLLLLISSRPETYIVVEINSPAFKSALVRTALDDEYLPEHDIKLFLEGTICEIKDAHPL